MTTFIKLSPFSPSFFDYKDGLKETLHPWSDTAFIQGGEKGIVISRKGGNNYVTAFVEVFIDNTFIRGEGSTLDEAETAAWNKYQSIKSCVEHEFEARGYTNGAAFCKRCNFFASHYYSGAELGQYCHTCNEPTVWSQTYVQNEQNEWTKEWFCEPHADEPEKIYYAYLKDKFLEGKLTEKERLSFLRLQFILNDYDDDEDQL